jgi:hypothetical protein
MQKRFYSQLKNILVSTLQKYFLKYFKIFYLISSTSFEIFNLSVRCKSPTLTINYISSSNFNFLSFFSEMKREKMRREHEMKSPLVNPIFCAVETLPTLSFNAVLNIISAISQLRKFLCCAK